MLEYYAASHQWFKCDHLHHAYLSRVALFSGRLTNRDLAQKAVVSVDDALPRDRVWINVESHEASHFVFT